MIASEAGEEKNRLSTGTLTFSDIENKAEYEASSVGVNVGFGDGTKDKDKGVTPNIGVTATGDSSSTTYSAVSAGTITVGGKTVNPENLSRDTENAVNALGKIFDKKTVQEQQELSKLFGEEAFKLVGDIAEREYKKAAKAGDQQGMDLWKEGGANKIALHALVGGIMSDLGGSSFVSGAVGAGVNEAIQGELSKIKDPALHQWASYVVGSAASAAVGGNAQTGGSVAASGTKNNVLNHQQIVALQKDIQDAINKGAKKEEIRAIVERYAQLSGENVSSEDSMEDGLEFRTDQDPSGSGIKQFLWQNFAFDWDANNTDADVNKTWDKLINHVSQPQTESYYWYQNGVTQTTINEYEYNKNKAEAIGNLATVIAVSGVGGGGSRGTTISEGAVIELEQTTLTSGIFAGRGSTGRTVPNNLNEQIAMKEVWSNPMAGEEIKNITLNDSRWPAAEGWVKMRQNVNGVEIHYVYNPNIGAFDDFKFK